ncbi:MAG: TPM domain-containing protein [Proteobacteria bacterium]|nr:TPM domain-containing protein [Pseudomonadota bacterium]
MRRRLATFALAALIFLPSLASAAFPKPKGFVNDFASVLSSDTRGKIESMLSAFERQSGVEVAIVTLPSLDGEPVENAAVKLFQEWGIGKKGKDNGALFLIAPNERRMRIEAGYGLEGAINDALAGRILDEAVLPRFRAGDMDAGIAAGSIAIVDEISRKEGIEFDAAAAYGSGAPVAYSSSGERKSTPLEIAIKIIVFIIMIIVFIRHPWLFLLLLSSRGGGGGRGFGGGFGGFGGGLSGGGGASRGW